MQQTEKAQKKQKQQTNAIEIVQIHLFILI